MNPAPGSRPATQLRLIAYAGIAVGSLALTMQSAGASYAVRTITAVTAIVLLCRPGTGTTRPRRLSQFLIAGALAMGVLSGCAATAHLLMTGEPTPAGGLADWLYLAYGPLAAAGLLALPRDAHDGPWRLGAAADAAVAVGALGYSLVGLISEMARESGTSTLAQAAAIAYPVGAICLLAVLLAVLPHAKPALQPFLLTSGAGVGLLVVSDIGYSTATLHHWYTPTTWPAVCAQAGLLMIALAGLRSQQPPAAPRPRRISPTVRRQLQTGAPYIAVLPAAVVSLVRITAGRGLSMAELSLAFAVGLALVCRQLLTNAAQERTLRSVRHREQRATAASRRDPLTDLGNRTALLEALQGMLAQSDGRAVALALLDLDDFKDVNDTHGHETGDEVLRAVAVRLTAAAPAAAVVARLGGDEFAVCVRTGERAEALGDALAAALADPVVVGQRQFVVTASIGVVLADAGAAATPAVALSHVDVAMYQAKATKIPQRSTLVVLAGEDRSRAAARVRMREEISHPDLTQFRVVYEPVVDLATGELAGAEALLRWRHPVLGEVGPADFVPLAEQVGAIWLLGGFALRTALTDLAGWLREAQEQGRPLVHASVGVNLSPRQLADPSLPEVIRDALAELGLPPHRLVLEITEQALVDDWETAIDCVRRLRQVGVAVAVDDFGTGYSSLRYLRRFETSTLKIDKEFVQAIADEPRTRALVGSVLDMARALDLYTVAEGVETLDQLAALRAMGCRYAQGYLFDRPLERAGFGQLLLARHRYPVGHEQRTGGLPAQPAERAAPDPRLPLAGTTRT